MVPWGTVEQPELSKTVKTVGDHFTKIVEEERAVRALPAQYQLPVITVKR